MEIVELPIEERKNLGKGASRKIRRLGRIPAVLYGHGMKSLALEVNTRDFHQVLQTKAGANVIIRLKGKELKLAEDTCRIQDIQLDPVSDDIDHVDFVVISLTEKIKVKVPLVIKNAEEALGLKEGGVLDVVHHEIEVECLPAAIPENFTVDVKNLKINDLVHVKDLQAPEGISFTLEADEVVVALQPPRKEEEAKPAEEAPTQPEVIEKGKKLEGEEGAEAASKDAKPAAKEAKPKEAKSKEG